MLTRPGKGTGTLCIQLTNVQISIKISHFKKKKKKKKNHGSRDSHLKMLTFSSVMKIMENCRTKTSFIYTVENIETSYIVFFSAIITSTICLLDLSLNGRLLLKY